MTKKKKKKKLQFSRFHYYCGLYLILGALLAMAWQLRASRILSFDMQQPADQASDAANPSH